MLNLSAEMVLLLMVILLVGGFLTGYALGTVMIFTALLVGFLVKGPATFEIAYITFFGLITNEILLAIPLFVFMGALLERSGLAERMYHSLFLFLGNFRGGLPVATVLLGAALACCMGVITASVATLSKISLSPMIKRHHSKSLAAAAVCAGGTLGVLIPPSIVTIVYGAAAGLSVGKLFMAQFIPGFLLTGLYCVYIFGRCFLQPEIAPVVDKSESAISFVKKLRGLLVSVVPVATLVLAVLGTIYFGLAPPAEAAAIGAFAMLLLVVAYRMFSTTLLRESVYSTLRTTCMIMWIGLGALLFSNIFIYIGCKDVAVRALTSMPLGSWGTFVLIMFILFVLGMFLDWLGIIFIMVPIYMPITNALGFDPIWVGVMVILNLQMAYLSPPFAPAIFVLRSAAPSELGITAMDAIRGIYPFIACVVIALGLCALFPQLALWLPGTMMD